MGQGTLTGLAGLGDLITTATSAGSHHHDLGRRLARGEHAGLAGGAYARRGQAVGRDVVDDPSKLPEGRPRRRTRWVEPPEQVGQFGEGHREMVEDPLCEEFIHSGRGASLQDIDIDTRIEQELEAGSEEGGEFNNYTKKERLMLTRQRDKLSKNLSGIKNLTRLPGLMFVIDSKKERIAVAEANKLGIPMIALVDGLSDSLRAAGVPMAVSTDHNPGTSPALSLLLMVNMACTLFRLTVPEAVDAVTVHAARALGLQGTHGVLGVGMPANFVLWDVREVAELAYWLGQRPVRSVVRQGRVVL